MHSYSTLVPLLVAWVGLMSAHLVRAVAARPEAARRWAAARSLTLTPRLQADLLTYLARLRWGRLWCTVAVGAVTVCLVLAAHPPISFLGLPLIMAVVIVELLTPQPRLSRVRVASLEHRPRSYFAPRHALRVVRLLLATAVALSGTGLTPLGSSWAHEQAVVHLLSLALGWGLLEYGLARLSRRGLCDRTEDAALDCAMRVADARSLTATGLLFGAWGLLLSLAPFPIIHAATPAMLLSSVAGVLLPAACAWAIALWQPLPAWSPS